MIVEIAITWKEALFIGAGWVIGTAAASVLVGVTKGIWEGVRGK